MINRIRDIRKSKGMTLADLAEACDPPTTPQTIGRLETGMRNLSLKWMDRIAAALEVDPEMIVRSEETLKTTGSLAAQRYRWRRRVDGYQREGERRRISSG